MKTRILHCGMIIVWGAFLLGGSTNTPVPLFSDVSEESGLIDAGNERGIAWGDFDDDGDPDLYIAVLDGPDRLYRNEGNKTFVDVTRAAGLADSTMSTAPAWGDFDGDGDLDLYVARVGPNALYLNDGEGFFADVAAAAGVDDGAVSWGLALGDHDLNGTIDIYVVNFDIPPNRLYSNRGDGTFVDVAATAGVADTGHGTSATWCDFDDDGDPDLYLANKDGANHLYDNNGRGVFTDVADSSGTQDTRDTIGTIWGDCDNDGDLDLCLSSNLADNRLFLNNGNGTFAAAEKEMGLAHAGASRGLGFADFDGDGHLDLYLVNSIGNNVLYRNSGQGFFEDVTEISAVGNSETGTTTAWADYDLDGDLDLLLSNFGGRMRLFENNQPPGPHWLGVRLRSPAPNTRAVGARVRVHAGPVTWTRENNTQGGYQSQSPYQLHFGLGSAATVDSVVVRWPSSGTTTFGPFLPDQVIDCVRQVGQ